MTENKTKHPAKQPKGIVCKNCSAFVFQHYAITSGRCWNCRALLTEEQCYDEGAGI